MLHPHQVIPFLLHDDPIVHSQALRYFRDAHDPRPLTADHYWQMLDRFQSADNYRSSPRSVLSGVPQTEYSYQRLIDALRRDHSNSDNYHFQHAVSNLDFALLQTHRDEILSCDQILVHTRDHLRDRLALADEPTAGLWERLMEFGREVKDKYAGEFDDRKAARLIEAIARDPGTVVEKAILVLNDESAIEDWREIFAIQLLGEVRYEPAIDVLIARLLIDSDMRETVQDALTKIGTLEVIEKIEAFYPGKEWHVRLYADDPIARIKRPQSEEALIRLLAEEVDPDLNLHLLNDLCDLGSLAGLDLAREIIRENPDNAENLGLAKALIAVAVMNEVDLPEAPAWRAALARRDAGVAKRMAAMSDLENEPFIKSLRDNWLGTGISSPARGADEFDEDDPDAFLDLLPAPVFRPPEPIEPFRRPSPKVGRNDPCPCGSGKKYKKCCGK